MTDLAPPPKSRLAGSLLLAFRAHVPALLLILTYWLVMKLLVPADAPEIAFDLNRVGEVLGVVGPVFLLGVLIAVYIRLIFARGSERPIERLRRWGSEVSWLELLALRLPIGLAFLIANQAIYITLKVSIPYIEPFSWDPAFTAADRWLFLGVDPWELTHALFASALSTAVIDALYVIWFFVVYLGFIGFAILPMTSVTRLAFLLAFGLGWSVGGSLMAVWFSSAGPVYYERLFGSSDFVPLMERLGAQSEHYRITALIVQEKLWQGYTLAEVVPVGISAFPSMHLCITAIVACAAFRIHRVAGWAMLLFTVAIFIGSIHLGWHYAVDSIAGLVIGVLFWWVGMMAARAWLSWCGIAAK